MAVVLVVDDDTVSRVVLRQLVLRQGHRVLEAASGQEALTILGTAEVDLIISDHEMPGMSGMELRINLGPTSTTPFVMLTGYVSEDEISGDDVAFIDGFVTKPVSSASVRALLERWLGPAIDGSLPATK